MKKKISIFVLTLLLISTSAMASDQWIFFYPGEAGSTAEAAPIISEFFDYLKEKNKDLSFEGAYFNTVDDGMNFISSKKPKVGILSYTIWEMKKSNFSSAKVALETRPLPSGMTSEQYILVGTEPLSDNGLPILTSEPLSDKFVSELLFTDMKGSHKLEQTNQMLNKLKEISKGALKGYAILTPMEAYTLSMLKSEWAKRILVLTKSNVIPTARLVLFNGGYKHMDALKKVLLEMNNDEEGKAILSELRLVGFQ